MRIAMATDACSHLLLNLRNVLNGKYKEQKFALNVEIFKMWWKYIMYLKNFEEQIMF